MLDRIGRIGACKGLGSACRTMLPSCDAGWIRPEHSETFSNTRLQGVMSLRLSGSCNFESYEDAEDELHIHVNLPKQGEGKGGYIYIYIYISLYIEINE